MKKVIIVLISIIFIVFGIVVIEMARPNLKRTCEVLDTGIILRVPNKYDEVVKDSENEILELFNNIEGILIKRSKS